jgi:hypothetical protein
VPQYGVAVVALPVLGFAPELNPYRLCPFVARRKTVNDSLMTRFVAILSRFMACGGMVQCGDARSSAGYAKGKGTNRERKFIYECFVTDRATICRRWEAVSGERRAEPVGELDQAGNFIIPGLCCDAIGRGAAAIFERTGDIGGGEAAGARGGEIAVMRGDEA